MAKVRLDRATALLIVAAASALPACAQNDGPNSVFGSNQMYIPGAMGTNIVDDTPPEPPKEDKKSKDSSSPVQAAPSGGGGSAPAAPGGDSLGNAPPGAPQGNNDFSSDETRMRKKYKAMLAYYKREIAKGDNMMRNSPDQKSADYKKGKIIKEIAEKHLADIQTNNPFQITDLEADDKKNGQSDDAPSAKKESKLGKAVSFLRKEIGAPDKPASKDSKQTASADTQTTNDATPTVQSAKAAPATDAQPAQPAADTDAQPAQAAPSN
ncbi:MAG TPA: hypothetical protein V6C81_24865 [Planktothrix sp.]|jgi:hypothetical protein